MPSFDTFVQTAVTSTGGLGGGGSDQDLWETFIADAGSTTANSPTDTLTVSGGTGISTSIVGDVLTIKEEWM